MLSDSSGGITAMSRCSVHSLGICCARCSVRSVHLHLFKTNCNPASLGEVNRIHSCEFNRAVRLQMRATTKSCWTCLRHR